MMLFLPIDDILAVCLMICSNLADSVMISCAVTEDMLNRSEGIYKQCRYEALIDVLAAVDVSILLFHLNQKSSLISQNLTLLSNP